jgi:AcrR family transcriptional regulator
MDSARRCLEVQGYSATSMIDIADTAEVSRATLYNHFRDKVSVFRAFFAYELERITSEAHRAGTAENALTLLARSVSTSSILETIRNTDPGLLVSALSSTTDPLWGRIEADMATLFGERASLVTTWLLGQVLVPISVEKIGAQIAYLGIR